MSGNANSKNRWHSYNNRNMLMSRIKMNTAQKKIAIARTAQVINNSRSNKLRCHLNIVTLIYVYT